MLHQKPRDLFDELMGKLADQELKNRGLKSDFMYDTILDELNEIRDIQQKW